MKLFPSSRTFSCPFLYLRGGRVNPGVDQDFYSRNLMVLVYWKCSLTLSLPPNQNNHHATLTCNKNILHAMMVIIAVMFMMRRRPIPSVFLLSSKPIVNSSLFGFLSSTSLFGGYLSTILSLSLSSQLSSVSEDSTSNQPLFMNKFHMNSMNKFHMNFLNKLHLETLKSE